MTADGRSSAFGAAGRVGVAFGLVAFGLVALVECLFRAVACFFTPGPKGWCLIAWVAAVVVPRWPSTVIPPPMSTAARSPSRAAYRTGGESVKVTESLSAAKRGDLKEEGRGVPRPSIPHFQLLLRAESGDDVRARAGLVPGLGAGGAVDAVGQGGRGLDVQLRRHDCRVVRLQQRDRHPRIAGGVGGAEVVGVVGLDSRDRSANVGLGGRVVRTIPEAQIRGDRDREQDAENDDDNEKLDEGETAFLTGEPPSNLAGVAVAQCM